MTLRSLVVMVGFAVAGCEETRGEERLDDYLDSDSYALFRVYSDGSEQTAVLVELRRAPPGTYVLLHTVKAPRSVGWFELDKTAFEQCLRAGEHVDVELSCLVPDGYGELVDLVTVAPKEKRTVVLRHGFSKCGHTCEGEERQRAGNDAYYAVMRVERVTGAPIPYSIEVRSLDGEYEMVFPRVERVR